MRSNDISADSSKTRSDGRKPLLIYLDPAIIRDLKIEALNRNTHVYLIIEELLKAREQ